MTTTSASPQSAGPVQEARWLGEPVDKFEGAPSSLSQHIPEFARRPFALGAPPDLTGLPLNYGENPYKDVIIRLPLGGETEIPVAVVSKNYKLVQHRELFEAATNALKRHQQIKIEQVHALVRLTRYGSRMALEFRLPKEFDFDPGDKHALKLCFHCFNSVDGSMKLFIAFGWFRFVCQNGVLVGTARLRHKMIHNEYLELPDLAILLADGLAAAEDEKSYYSTWLKTPIELDQLAAWADGPVKKKWKPKAAARIFHICTTGFDGEFSDPFEEGPPSCKRMVSTQHVPGMQVPANNAYAVCQALSWVATQRNDLSDQIEFTRQIPDLMRALVK